MSIRRTLTLLIILLMSPVLAEPDGKVSISLTEFLKLRNQQTSQGEAPPRQFLLSGCHYNISLKGDWVEVVALSTLEVKASSWQEVPLVSQQAILSATRLDGKAVPVYQKDGKFTLLTRQPGSHRLELVYRLPIKPNGPSQGFTFTPLDSPVGEVRLELPTGHLKLTSQPPAPMKRKGRIATMTLLGGADRTTLLSWERPNDRPQNKKPLRVRGQVRTQAQVSETAVRCVSFIDYQISGETRRLQLDLPTNVEVLGVEAPGLSGWTALDSGTTRQVLCAFEAPASGELTVKVVYEKPLESINGTWDLPSLRLQGARLSKGHVAVKASGAIEVRPAGLEEARELDPSALPSSLGSERVLCAFKYNKQPYQIALETFQGEEVTMLTASIDSARARTLVTPDGKVISSFTYQVRNNRKQSLEFHLPPGLQVWSAFVDGQASKPVETDDGGIKVALVTGQNGEPFPVELTCVGQVSLGYFAGSSDFQAPSVDVPISSLEWTIHWPTERGLWGFQTDMQQVSAPSTPTLLGDQDKESPVLSSNRRPGKKRIVSKDEEDGVYLAAGASNAPSTTNMAMLNLVQATSQGSFPVRVRVPNSGQPFSFQKLMVTDEMPRLQVRYYDPDLLAAIAWGTGLFLLAFLAGLGRRISRRRQEELHDA